MTIKAFWAQIKSLLKQKGISQESAARMCKVSINTWYGWASKEMLPHVSYCKRIAEILGISLDYLVTGKQPDTAAQIKEIRDLLDKAREKLEKIQTVRP
jgi:transcriptional regulator with XRE-family HTH domain